MADAAAAPSRARRSAGLALRLAVAAGLLAYLAHAQAIDWRALAGLLHRGQLVLVALALVAASSFLTAVRLPVLLAPAGYRLGAWPAVVLSTIGLFFGIFLPGGAGGDLAKIYYALAGQRRGTRVELATVVLLDRAVGMWAMFAVPLVAYPLFASEAAGAGAIGALVRFSALVFAAGGAALALVLFGPESLLRLAPQRLAGGLVARGIATVRFYREHTGALARAFGLSLLTHATAIAAVWCVAGAVAPASQRALLVLVVPLGFVANALPLTPGGLGVGELAYHRLFAAVGMDGGAEVALGWRFLLLLLSLAGGLFYVRGRSRSFIDAPAAPALGARK